MKKIICLLIFILFISCKQQEKNIKLVRDKRIELVSIAYQKTLSSNHSNSKFYKSENLPHTLFKKINNFRVANNSLFHSEEKIKTPFENIAFCLDDNFLPKKTGGYSVFSQDIDSFAILLKDFKKYTEKYEFDIESFNKSLKSENLTKKVADFFKLKKMGNFDLVIVPSKVNKVTTIYPIKNNDKITFILGVCEEKIIWNKTHKRNLLEAVCKVYTDKLFEQFVNKDFYYLEEKTLRCNPKFITMYRQKIPNEITNIILAKDANTKNHIHKTFKKYYQNNWKMSDAFIEVVNKIKENMTTFIKKRDC